MKKKIGGPPPMIGVNSRLEYLPSRHALAKLTGGDPFQRSSGMFAKRTPSGLLGAPATYQDIRLMGEKGIDILKK